jgi:hypothetical protein
MFGKDPKWKEIMFRYQWRKCDMLKTLQKILNQLTFVFLFDKFKIKQNRKKTCVAFYN